ncbi:hypothetical protein GO495_22460 [Chitinophaga oryziterrae]|uniref:Uncharacterized protein n=1 Tax=Chitinophaga oryziterrae TaxID=1031224 RepID=A0A6N8JGF0_9BACT|nr:hypothetical protein [Chitinophaga oryziterrae]MVT43378.1 hypothetical protein [Chitinophaga oryziterrae]
MEEQSGSIFSSEFDDVQPVKRRWLILPWWIRAFSWLFLLTGALSPFILIAGLFGIQVSLSLYGMESTGPVSFAGFCLVVLFMLKGIAAYGLWAEKNWGIVMALADGLLGVVIRIVSMFIPDHSNSTQGFILNFRLDLIVLVIYLIKLYRLKGQWDESGK